jgi:integrase
LNHTFQSRFAERLTTFVAQKRALGWSYNGSEAMLARFDKFCSEQYPDSDALTSEICLAWTVRRETEGNNSFRNRIATVREFARHLNRIGEQAFIIPAKYAKKGARPVPYIYSEEEIARIWREFDAIEPRDDYPVRHFVAPAFVRLLYCCGLRPCEARKLMVDDVNLDLGKLYIRESKGYKDRIVMMAEDVLEYFIQYNNRVSKVLPGRKQFFSSSTDTICGSGWFEVEFRKIRVKLDLQQASSNPPRLYDFRHTFATHRLYKWLREGKDLTAMLPYLSAYMGHTLLSDTYYYIHLVPGQLEAMSGLDFSKYEALLPEVECYE